MNNFIVRSYRDVIVVAGLVSSVRRARFKAERSWVQIPARYSGWPGHYNNVGCSARFEISFELNPVTESK